MDDWLRDSAPPGLGATPAELALWLGCAFLFGGGIAAVYRATHPRDHTYPPTFVPTLVLLTVLLALVTQVVGGSSALAFSLLGALSIIRFRTMVPDTRDTAFVIFAVVVGMAVGRGHWEVALAGLAVGGLTAFLVRP